MADRFEVTVVTCAPGVLQAAPIEVPFTFTTGVLIGFEIVIPAGHSGLTGIALGYGHTPVVPYTQPGFFSGDDDVIRRLVKDKVPGVPWSAFVCNEDLQAHVWEVRFDYNEIVDTGTVVTPDIIAPADILAAGVDAMTGG